jgi:hypothetical protein
MFTDLYLQTTDPNLPIGDLLSPTIFKNIIMSMIVHTIIYASFFNLASYIFLGKILSSIVNTRLIISLLLIMFFGFFGRVYYVKEIYRAYDYDVIKARRHVDKFFISWVFLS